MQAMQKLDQKNTFKALTRSFKKKFRQEILKSSANVEFKENKEIFDSPQKEDEKVDLDDDQLEQFFSDEEPTHL